MGCGCCDIISSGPPHPCSITITVLDACTSAPVAGVSIAIMNAGHATVCTGSTDSSGVFTCTPMVPGGFTIGALTVGGCSYTGTVMCGIPLTLYYCTGSIDYQAVDDSGAPVGGVTYVATPFGTIYGGYATVASMTGGAPGGAGGQWESTSPGTAVFCWFSTARPLDVFADAGNPVFLTCPYAGHATACYLGTVGCRRPDSCARFDDTYWNSCTPPPCVSCGTNAAWSPVFYRRSLWNYMPWCQCHFLPKTLHATMNGPGAVLGSDAGSTIALTWDSTSWDGDPCTALLLGTFGPYFNTMRYTSGCRGANGAGGYCYYDFHNPAGNVGFVAYQSARVDLAIRATGTVGGNPVLTSLTYKNFWNSGCPTPDDFCVCVNTSGIVDRACPPGMTSPHPPFYCIHVNTLATPPSYVASCQYPMSITWGLYDPPTDALVGCPPPSHFCSPVDLVSADYSDGSCGWKSCCTDPYLPEFGLTSSATVTT